MEIYIESTIINILNCSSNNYIETDVIKVLDEKTEQFIKNKINKCMSCTDTRITTLDNINNYTDLIKRYLSDLIDLKGFGSEISKKIYDLKMQGSSYFDSNIMVVKYLYDSIPYLIILDLKLNHDYVSFVDYANNNQYKVLEIDNVLKDKINKDDSFCIIDCLNNTFYIKDITLEINNESKKLLSDLIFDAKLPMNDKEKCKILNDTVKNISLKYEESVTNTIPELKSIINDSNDIIVLNDIVEHVFEKDEAKDEFKQAVKEIGFDDQIEIDKSRLTKKEKTQKFITENGIEITIPANFVKRKDKVEIINNSDGTVSIAIKNITHLKNK